MNVLITSAGRRVSLVRSFQKELKKIDPQGRVFASDSDPTLSAACHVADGFFKVPSLKEPDYMDVLLAFCQSHDIALVIPTIDTELLSLATSKAHFEALGIQVVISSVEFVTICRDKRRTHTFFVEHQVQAAKEFPKDNYTLPLFIKPFDGSRSLDTYVIRCEADLTPYHFENEKLMFLEYLGHDDYDEYTCDLYYDKSHQLRCAVPRKRLEVRDGEVYKALAVNNCLVDYIKKNLNYIEGAVGCLTAQFFLHKTDPGKMYGIEINPRFGGGYPLTYGAGANYTQWILEEYLLHKTIEDKFNVWETDLLMVRYDDEILIHGYKG